MPNPDIWKWAGKGAHKLRGKPQTAEHVQRRIESVAKTLRKTRRVCAHCKRKFKPTSAPQRYCSGQCWNAVARKKRAKQHSIGISPTLYAQLSEAQGGVCAICDAPSGGNARKDRLAADHCHQTKRLRGLLCHRCNTAIGLLRDRADLLQKAARYLESPPFNIPIFE